LRTKCDLEIVRDWKCIAVRGAAAPDDRVDGALPIVWPGTTGFDLLGPSVEPPPGVEVVDAIVYERARIEAGVPALGAELTEATIPAEAGQWFVDASVSFTKGCFTGQELVARMDARGANAPRPIRGLRVHGRTAVGDEVAVGGNVIGALTSAAATDDGATVALAPLSRTIATDTEVEVAGQAGCVVALPMT
jgi:folate-binding protein YgfZ